MIVRGPALAPYYPESLRLFLADDRLGMARHSYLNGSIEVDEFERQVEAALLASEPPTTGEGR